MEGYFPKELFDSKGQRNEGEWDLEMGMHKSNVMFDYRTLGLSRFGDWIYQ